MDTDAKISLCHAIFALLEHERFQQLLIFHYEVHLLTNIILDTSSLEGGENAIDVLTNLPTLEPEEEDKISVVCALGVNRLWDLSELPEFAARYPPESKLVQEFVTWLSQPRPHLQFCACYLLRNVASSEHTATRFLEFTRNNHRLGSLFRLLKTPTNPQVNEEGLRLLKNLAMPESNKVVLGHEEAALGVVMDLCLNEERPPVQYAAVSALRQLLKGCFPNVIRFLWTSQDPAEPSGYVQDLLLLYHNDQPLATRMEIGRLIIEIWRMAYKEDAGAGTEVANAAIDQVNDPKCSIIAPIYALITDSGNQSLVTEGWFGLTLGARSPKGANLIYDFLSMDSTQSTFRDIITSQRPRSQDQNNAMILCDRLVTHYVSLM